MHPGCRLEPGLHADRGDSAGGWPNDHRPRAPLLITGYPNGDVVHAAATIGPGAQVQIAGIRVLPRPHHHRSSELKAQGEAVTRLRIDCVHMHGRTAAYAEPYGGDKYPPGCVPRHACHDEADQEAAGTLHRINPPEHPREDTAWTRNTGTIAWQACLRTAAQAAGPPDDWISAAEAGL